MQQIDASTQTGQQGERQELQMESGQEQAQSEKSQRRHIITIAPEAPEREAPAVFAPDQSQPGENQAARDAEQELIVILTHIEGYFDPTWSYLDLEALHFTLRHLFSQLNLLYRRVLPELERYSKQEQVLSAQKDLLYRQKVWLHLQAINRTLDRMAPLCHLLSDVIECLLDTLDNEEIWLRTLENEETRDLEQVKKLENSQANAPALHGSHQVHTEIEPAHWERAVTALMDRLLSWQDQHNKLTPFETLFSGLMVNTYDLSILDGAFALLLDSAGAIFGDILPNFRLVRREKHEEISALLFDLMQQSDQMLAQFEAALGPLTRLIRLFATVGEHS